MCQHVEADVADSDRLHDIVLDDWHIFLGAFAAQNSTAVSAAQQTSTSIVAAAGQADVHFLMGKIDRHPIPIYLSTGENDTRTTD